MCLSKDDLIDHLNISKAYQFTFPEEPKSLGEAVAYDSFWDGYRAGQASIAELMLQTLWEMQLL